MKKLKNGNYYALYGCYHSRWGYKSGNGGNGMALSTDGLLWTRVSDTMPIISSATSDAPAWENKVVYQPYLVEINGAYWKLLQCAWDESIWSQGRTGGL
jgi:hypothetical protein